MMNKIFNSTGDTLNIKDNKYIFMFFKTNT